MIDIQDVIQTPEFSTTTDPPPPAPSPGCHGKEHGLQIVTLAAKAQVDLGAQARAARLALRCFRAEPRLVPRALLALSASGPGKTGRTSPDFTRKPRDFKIF